MTKFIELTNYDGEAVIINVSIIDTIKKETKVTSEYLYHNTCICVGSEFILVRETYDFVKRVLSPITLRPSEMIMAESGKVTP